MKVDGAIIGGTGVGSLIAEAPGRAMFVPTRFGLVKGKVIEHDGASIYCLARHSSGHRVPPHRVAYRAMADALRGLGAKACVASAAVGSINPRWRVGQLVLCKDLIDLSGRNLTIFDDSVEHRDVSVPFSRHISEALLKAAAGQGTALEQDGIYVNTNGPRYETPAEIQGIGRLGGNLVGMTAASEAVAMAESNVPYACVAVVTNAAAGLEATQLVHDDVSRIMRQVAKDLFEIMLSAASEVGRG